MLLQGLHPMTLQNKDKEKCDRIAALESKLVETWHQKPMFFLNSGGICTISPTSKLSKMLGDLIKDNPLLRNYLF